MSCVARECGEGEGEGERGHNGRTRGKFPGNGAWNGEATSVKAPIDFGESAKRRRARTTITNSESGGMNVDEREIALMLLPPTPSPLPRFPSRRSVYMGKSERETCPYIHLYVHIYLYVCVSAYVNKYMYIYIYMYIVGARVTLRASRGLRTPSPPPDCLHPPWARTRVRYTSPVVYFFF